MGGKQARQIYLAPSYDVFGKDRIFDVDDPNINRDDGLLPYIRLRRNLAEQGMVIHTDDFLLEGGKVPEEPADYYSFGVMRDYEKLRANYPLNFRAFVIFEPPLVARRLYKAIPYLQRYFSHIYVHNTHGDGYSLNGVNQSNLHKLYWPQPYDDVIEKYWSNTDRLQKMVVINGNHNPLLRLEFNTGELYSARIEAMAELARENAVDLYGRAWDQWWHPRSMWLPYWRHRKTLMSIYRGGCRSKYEVLGRYQFCLCIENIAMDGYVTEKIFDCLYAGTVPLYFGAKDIDSYIPREAYVDARQYRSWSEMWQAVRQISPTRISEMKVAGRSFLKSEAGMRHFESLDRMFSPSAA